MKINIDFPLNFAGGYYSLDSETSLNGGVLEC